MQIIELCKILRWNLYYATQHFLARVKIWRRFIGSLREKWQKRTQHLGSTSCQFCKFRQFCRDLVRHFYTTFFFFGILLLLTKKFIWVWKFQTYLFLCLPLAWFEITADILIGFFLPLGWQWWQNYPTDFGLFHFLIFYMCLN